MFKAAIFDLDGTLVDFFAMKKKAANSAARAMVKAGLRMDVKTAQKKLYESYLKDIEGDRVFEGFLRAENSFTDRILAAGVNAYLKTKYKMLKPFPGALKTLKHFRKKGLKMAVLTDAPKLKAYMRLDEIKLFDFFDFVVAFEDTGERKPSSLPFRKAIELLNVSANETLYIGDWPERDILGAKNIGMKTAWAKYSREKNPKNIKADYVLEKIEDLIKIV